jgi:hypothetical protein
MVIFLLLVIIGLLICPELIIWGAAFAALIAVLGVLGIGVAVSNSSAKPTHHLTVMHHATGCASGLGAVDTFADGSEPVCWCANSGDGNTGWEKVRCVKGDRNAAL